MKNNLFTHVFPLVAAVVSMLFTQGCTTNGYITSSVATVVGLDVSENPKTQIPHVKFGYARTGLYYVPTGKTAYGDSLRQGVDDAAGNRDSVKDTPTLVSEIFVHSKFLGGITISEKFAIGDAAVKSSAAATAFANNGAHAVASNGRIDTTGGSIVGGDPLPPSIQPGTTSKTPKGADSSRGVSAEVRRAREVLSGEVVAMRLGHDEERAIAILRKHKTKIKAGDDPIETLADEVASIRTKDDVQGWKNAFSPEKSGNATDASTPNSRMLRLPVHSGPLKPTNPPVPPPAVSGGNNGNTSSLPPAIKPSTSTDTPGAAPKRTN
ncbi:MAG: hypothetical protein ABIP20_19840 [Chthoniobacteraceae bacterium]